MELNFRKPETKEVGRVLCLGVGRAPGLVLQGRKVRGVIHWVSAETGVPSEIRLFEPLFKVDFPDGSDDELSTLLNPDSRHVVRGVVESVLAYATVDDRFQFEREGYFCVDEVDSKASLPVFNRIVGLRDSWARIEQKGAQSQ